MKFSILIIIEQVIQGMGVLTAIYGVYFVLLAILGAINKKDKIKEMPPATRFVLVIAARNEAAVIGHLVDSLQRQNYPSALYDIYVVPNNCTDNTRGISIAHGAKIFDTIGKIRSKGDALSQCVDFCIKEKKYDAICIFDADNIVHADFLQFMNSAKLSGAQIAQGFKDSKNPSDSAVSTCFSIYYWMIGYFYNASREALQLSSLITGTGFMITIPFLEKIGGWNTKTITEDYEFSAQCVLAGERIRYIPDAIVYDEQPLTFRQSWKQRRRWSTGNLDSSKYYLKELLEQALHRRSASCFDLAIAYMNPVISVLSFIALFGQSALIVYKMYTYTITNQLQHMSANLFLGFIFYTLFAAFIIYKHKGQTVRGFGRGIVFFPVFLLSWLLITIISLFKKQKKWEVIAHTRTLTLNDL